MDAQKYWEMVYRQKRASEVSWYQPRLELSLRLLAHAGLSETSEMIDVGGGASTLVDDVLARGVRDVTVLDISGHALAMAKTRLGQHADKVQWIEADVTQAGLPSNQYDLWHDRAVFHFLTGSDDRGRYLAALHKALKPGGQLVIATFNLQGPPRCSGLEVVRYSPETLQAALGPSYRLLEAVDENHQTPFRTVQSFTYCRFQKVVAT